MADPADAHTQDRAVLVNDGDSAEAVGLAGHPGNPVETVLIEQGEPVLEPLLIEQSGFAVEEGFDRRPVDDVRHDAVVM